MRTVVILGSLGAQLFLGTPVVAQVQEAFDCEAALSANAYDEIRAFTHRLINLDTGNAWVVCNRLMLHTAAAPDRIQLVCENCQPTSWPYFAFTTRQVNTPLQIGGATATAAAGCSINLKVQHIGQTSVVDIGTVGTTPSISQWAEGVHTIVISAKSDTSGDECSFWISEAAALGCHGLNALLQGADCASAIDINRPLQGMYDDTVHHFTCFRVFDIMHKNGCLANLDQEGAFTGWQV